MIAPSLLAWLIGSDVLHKWYYMPVIYGVYCAAAMLSLLFIRETRDVTMENLDQEVDPVSEVRAEKALP
jgi:hypothetical protein